MASDLPAWIEIHGHPLYAAQDAPQRRTERRSAGIFEEFLKAQRQDPRTEWEMVVELDGRMIGTVGLRNPRSGTGVLGWGFHPDHWGSGYALEATEALMQFARADLKLIRLEAWIYASNQASQALALKLGLHLEATLRSRVRWGDGWMNDCIYARVYED